MISKIFILLLGLVASVSIGIAKEESFVIAKVNNHIITSTDVQDRYRYVISSSKIKINSNEEKTILLNQIVDKMIDEELIRQEAAELKIEVSEDDIDNAIENITLRQKKNLLAFKKSFSEKNISYENFCNQVKAELLWSKIISDSLRSRIKITDFEIKEFFEQQKLSTDITKYLIAEVVIANENNETKILASKLSSELKHGANFKNIVKQFSHSPTSENNGELGWVSKGDIDEKIYNVISKLEKNGYSEPVLIADNYYIFKLIDKKSVTQIHETDLSIAKQRIFTRELEIEAKRYLMDLHKKSFIETNKNF